jgi:CHC2 zinc finger
MVRSETTRKHRHRGVTGRSVIQAAKEAVRVLDLADLLCGPGQMRRVGKEWVARCPLPGHEDRIPSFCVDPEKNVFFCHGCVRGGGVVQLAAFAWGHDRMDSAAAEVLYTIGHPIPERPGAWFRKQRRQKAARDALYEAKVESCQRRMFRHLSPILEDIQSDTEREQEAQHLWRACRQIGMYMVAQGENQ